MALCPFGSSSSFTPATVTTEHYSDAPHPGSTNLACQAGPCLTNNIGAKTKTKTLKPEDLTRHSGQSAAMFAVSFVGIPTATKTADT
jgi:hypothetical protein